MASLLAVSQPTIQTMSDGYVFTWENGDEQHVSIGLSRMHEDSRRNSLTAEIEVAISTIVIAELMNEPLTASTLKTMIAGVNFNLLSHTARANIIKTIDSNCIIEQLRYYPWTAIIGQVCTYAIREYRKGADIQVIYTDEYIEPLKYLLEPLLIKNMPTAIFAEKGHLKSTLATVYYMTLTLPWVDNPLGFKAPADPVNTLILDWEYPNQDDKTYARIAKKLQQGMGTEPFPVYRLACARPLADDLDKIQRKIQEWGAECLIIDSLGMAAGGELKESQSATEFYAALGKLGTTSLILAQTSKDTEGGKRKTIYGSTFFRYYARSIYELVKEGEIESEDNSDVNVALFHRDSNLTRKNKPISFNFNFNHDVITVKRQPVDYGEFIDKVSAETKVVEALKADSCNREEIAAYTNLSETHVGKVLTILKKADKVVSLERGKWGLAITYE